MIEVLGWKWGGGGSDEDDWQVSGRDQEACLLEAPYCLGVPWLPPVFCRELSSDCKTWFSLGGGAPQLPHLRPTWTGPPALEEREPLPLAVPALVPLEMASLASSSPEHFPS